MLVSLEDLREKEVISITDGSRYGYIGDVTFDIADGKVRELVVPGRRRFLGLFGPRENLVFPWNQVHRFGQETVLIEGTPKSLREGEKERHKLDMIRINRLSCKITLQGIRGVSQEIEPSEYAEKHPS